MQSTSTKSKTRGHAKYTSHSCSNLLELAQQRALMHGDKPAFVYLSNGQQQNRSLSYADLDRCAKAIAAELQQHDLSGQTILLLLPTGIDFLIAFFACLYAKTLPIPAFPASGMANRARIRAMLEDAEPTAILTLEQDLAATTKWLRSLNWTGSTLLAVDTLSYEHASSWVEPRVTAEDPAFIQYTSGSTAAPRGVLITHANIIHNESQIQDTIGHDDTAISVSWLPLFHDMGLVASVLQSFYVGGSYYFMSPIRFLEKPIRWLQAIDRYRASVSGAPNFAFDLCCQRIDDSELEGLDLSHWRIAFNGSEPIYHETLERFYRKFSHCGLRKQALQPCYGLAEATILVSGGPPHKPYRCKALDPKALQQHRVVESTTSNAKTIVSCGRIAAQQQVLIVDPETLLPCDNNAVGEIWIRGASISQGYWHKQGALDTSLHGYRQDTHEGPYLRSGDLGFIDNDQLYVTGRLKDLIIIHGQNHYPQDIEASVSQSHPALRADACAAFTVERTGREQLILAQELERAHTKHADPQSIVDSIVSAVAQNHEIDIDGIVLLRHGQIPKTTSGKIQRHACKQRFLANRWKAIYLWSADDHQPIAGAHVPMHGIADNAPAYQSALDFVKQSLARLLRKKPNVIDKDQALNNLGLSSLKLIKLSAIIEHQYGLLLPLDEIFSGTTVAQLADYVAQQSPKTEASNPVVLQSSKRESHDAFALTDIQQAYWLGRSSSFLLGNINTHAYLEITIKHADVDQLADSLNRLIQHHPMMRAVVLATGEQKVLAQRDRYQMVVIDHSAASQVEVEVTLAQIRSAMRHQVFATHRWPLFEVRCLLLPDRGARIHLSIDMLIADGWSIIILIKEWMQLYADPAHALHPIECQFSDYVQYRQQRRQLTSYQTARAYWLQQIEHIAGPPSLPFAVSPQAIEEPKFHRHFAKIEARQWGQLKVFCVQQGLTPSALLLAAYAQILGVWSKDPEFSINVTLFDRPPIHPHINQIIGDFTSLLLIGVDQTQSKSFREQALAIQVQLLRALTHRDFSGVELIQALANKNPFSPPYVVFTSLLDMGITIDELIDANIEIDWPSVITQTSQSCLDNMVWEQEGQLMIAWDVVDSLFPGTVITDMFQAFIDLLGRLSQSYDNWNQSLYDEFIPTLQIQRREQINHSERALTTDCLHSGFIRYAKLNPTAPAIIDTQRSIDYGELADMAAGVAQTLLADKIGANSVVPVVMHKGWEQIAAVLGIVSAGSAYLPIDPNWPEERQRYILEHSGAKVLLTTNSIKGNRSWMDSTNVLTLDSILRNVGNVQADSVLQPRPASPEDLAYVLFTSGTTGRPKGVKVPHRGALNTLNDINRRFRIGPTDRVLALSSLCFDLSVFDIFGTLAAGACIVLPNADRVRDPEHWYQMVSRHKVTLWNSVPAFIQIWHDWLMFENKTIPASLRLVMLSGDWIPVALPDDLRQLSNGIEIMSLAGPTETSIWSLSYDTKHYNHSTVSIPYGCPLTNQYCYILKPNKSISPDWVAGELFIGGAGLAQGYWNDELKTQEKFITHPITGERLFRSGDMARYLPDGNIEFLGRKDTQVKINGYRIELKEIEAVLMEHRRVDTAAVIVDNKANGHDQLIAYISGKQVLTNAREIETEVRHYIEQKLPDYMLPKRIIVIENMPLSDNGKLDYRQLPQADVTSRTDYHSANTDTEQILCEILMAELGVTQVGIHDNFNELGANSRIIVQIHRTICEKLKCQIDIIDVFKYSNIERLAAHIDKTMTAVSTRDAQQLSAIESRVQKRKQNILRTQSRRKAYNDHYDNTALPAHNTDDAAPNDALIMQASQRDAFKQGDNNLRDELRDHTTIALDRNLSADASHAFQRKTVRDYTPRPITLDTISQLLSCLAQEPSANTRHYQYPSAGGLYPVQVYLSIKADSVQGLGAGVYYYHPAKHELYCLHDGDIASDQTHIANNYVIAKASAFSIYFIADMAAIAPLYGELSREFCLIEVGAMLQVLMQQAPKYNIGVCPIGHLDFDPLRDYFQLGSKHQFIHSLVAGNIQA